MDRAPHIEAQDVALVYPNGLAALDGVAFAAEPGSFTAIVGPSGCGKSSFLRLVAGLERPSSGGILLDGEPPADACGRAGGLALVFQEPRLLPWRSVRQQLALPFELAGQRPDSAAITHALELVGLAEFARSLPHQLSGGMSMRCALARALVTRPRLLLLDEPFGALDEITRERLGEHLLALHAEFGWTALLVTHSVYEAVFLSSRVLVMSGRPGRIAAQVPVERAARDAAFRAAPEFAALTARISDLLRSDRA